MSHIQVEVGEGNFLNEHALRNACADFLDLEARVFKGSERPWRTWEGCRFFGQVIRAARDAIQRKKIVHEEVMKQGGRTWTERHPPCLACPADGCKTS